MFTTRYAYDSNDNITQTTYPSGLVINREFDAYGYLDKVKNGDNSIILYDAMAVNAYDKPTRYRLGNGRTSTANYNASGQPTAYITNSIQNLHMTWQANTGNLTRRRDYQKGKIEDFTYDNLNRLTSAHVSNLPMYGINYKQNGNISSKTAVGNYRYSNSRPNAVSSLTNYSNVSEFDQDIRYNHFDQPAEITEVKSESGALDLMYIGYGVDQQRHRSSLYRDGTRQYSRYYAGAQETTERPGRARQHVHYIAGGDGLAAIIVRENGIDEYHYVYKDHLGSILTLTNTSGQVTQEQNFGAWGQRRNTTTWAQSTVVNAPEWLYRGYTGHEHLDEFKLINMNGRMYDPVLGQMLSIDNYVASDINSQAYNRYTYAFNNPLRYVDPDGELPIAVIIVAAAFVNVSVNLLAGNVDNGWEFFGYMAIGAVGAAAGAGVGVAVGSAFSTTSFIAGASTAAAGAFAATLPTSFGNALLGGRNIGEATAKGFKDAALSAAFAGVIGGISGGLDAVLDGRNFIHGGRLTQEVQLDIASVTQIGNTDCTYACMESVDDFYGGARTQTDFARIAPGSTGEGLRDPEVVRMIQDSGYTAEGVFINQQNATGTAQRVADQVQRHRAVLYTYDTGQTGQVGGVDLRYNHATVVNRVRIFDNGRFAIRVMNPATGGTKTIRRIRQARSIWAIFR